MNTYNNENDNLIMFPASKNFLKVDRTHDLVESLLNEFAHISDEDIPSYLDDRFDDVERDIEVQTYQSLEAFMNRHNVSDLIETKVEDERMECIQMKLEEIKETRKRLKFYLDEIEMFLPNKK